MSPVFVQEYDHIDLPSYECAVESILAFDHLSLIGIDLWNQFMQKQ